MIRKERDLLGVVSVPIDARYGIQTQRAVDNFPYHRQLTIGHYPNLVKALLWVKQSAAIANHQCGYLKDVHKDAILKAVANIMENPMVEDFPVHRLHGGGGTSANMNANEILAFMGNKIIDKTEQDGPLHPNDHVNLHQSTNDVYPTACRISIILEWQSLNTVLKELSEIFTNKADAFMNINHLARTCLQDAVPITFQGFFSAYAAFVERGRKRLECDIQQLHRINLGGTIVGDITTVPSDYLDEVILALQQLSNDTLYSRSDNLFDAAQNPDDMLTISGSLDTLARGLIKIAKDIRFLISGPEAGLNELFIPAVQPGSSAMPGKVNPVIPEFLIQSCMEAMGKCHTVKMAMDHGELDLNVWESVMTFNVLDAMDVLEQAVYVFTNKCANGINVNKVVNQKNCNTTIALLAKLSQIHGYKHINNLCQKALEDQKDIRDILYQNKLIPQKTG